MISGQLPFGSSNIGCIEVASGVTLTINSSYTFTGTNFKMGAGSKILINAPFRLTLQNQCKLEGCNGMWDGITLDPSNAYLTTGGQLDMSDSRLEDATTGVYAQNQSKIRFVSNVFADNTFGLKIRGFVSFINFENPHDFANNLFYAAFPIGAAAITFEDAAYFTIGEDVSGMSSVVNTITDYPLGIDIKSSTGINIFGMTFRELYGSWIDQEPIFSNRIGVKIYYCKDISVKHCTMTGILNTPLSPPNFGIVSLFGYGKLTFSNNDITANAIGISSRLMSLSGTQFEAQDNDISADVGIEVRGMSTGINKNLKIKGNVIEYHPVCFWNICSYFRVGGIFLYDVGVPNQVQDNQITNTTSVTAGGMNGLIVDNNTGLSEISDNVIDFQGDNAGNGLLLFSSRNCNLYRNVVTGAQYNNPPLANAAINTGNCINIAFCCNAVSQSDYGTRFNSANSDIQFFTTTYGAHDNGLYFSPAAAMNPQNNTGNSWTTASTTLDALYDGSLFQAQANAPFRTSLSNINSSKIVPSGWFTLIGTDPNCSQASFSCPATIPPGEYTEITPHDTIGLSAVNSDNEYTLRFQQKRQLFRKLAENPQLVNWNASISNFYTAAQSNSVGAFDAIDEAFRRLCQISPGIEQTYTPLAYDMDSLGAALNDIRSQYPNATISEQEQLLEQAWLISEQIDSILAQLNALQPSVESDLLNQITQLLSQNSALSTATTWEANEKNINDLYFKDFGGLVDTFTIAEKNFIETLALSCPQYEGIGVYKARELYQKFATTTPVYDEHDCQPLEERSQNISLNSGSELKITPNPASDNLILFYGAILPEGSFLVLFDAHGNVGLKNDISNQLQSNIDVSSLHSGLYILSIYSSEVQFPPTKVIVLH